MKHHFIFTPGVWIGQGRILFSFSPQHVRFYTKWAIEDKKKQIIYAEQQIEQEGEMENLFNSFTFKEMTDTSFTIELSNDHVGTVKGSGVITDKHLAWEFLGPTPMNGSQGFEGFEIYELQENGDYMLHAEYSSMDHRTVIDGRIWKKS